MVEEMSTDNQDDDFVKPRPYQEVMRDICVRQNSIIYLPTGAGKTFIAVLVIRHFAKALEKDLNEGGKRTVFVVNTVALARQQSEALRKVIPFEVGLYSGEMNVDAWKRDRWREEFQKNQVIVATVQIIVDVINHGYLSVTDINVLVVDECHSGLGDHPMHQLMQKFENIPKSMQPRVIGLTGILLNNPSPQTVEDELRRLENVYQGTIATVENALEFENVMKYSTDPEEKMIGYDPTFITPKMEEITKRVKKMIEVSTKFQLVTYRSQTRNLKQDIPSAAKEVKKLLNEFLYQMEDVGIYGASIAILSVLVQLELNKLQCQSTQEADLYKSVITVADSIRHDLVRIMDCEESEYNKLMVFGSAKLKQLVQYLMSYVDESPERYQDMKCLVFVQRRHSAKVVYHILKRVFLEKFDDDVDPEKVKPDFMVGRSQDCLPESIEQILADKNQSRVLQKFKKGETNLIVASSVLEEGIDIQSCNLVIRFDLPLQYRSYVQTKGRARMKNSRYILMIPKNDAPKFYAKYQVYKEIDAILKKCLIGKTVFRMPPLAEDISAELYNQLIPPFVTKSGATLTALSALQLLNRYAMGMPHDKFTNTSVYWEHIPELDSGRTRHRVKLYLPVQSTIKTPILSDAMENVKIAKRHAAFIACKQLYLNGELNENLLPINNEKKIEDQKEIYFKHWEEFMDDNPKLAGTKQHKRAHNIVYPEELTACTPIPGEVCFLYMLHFEPLFVAPSGIDNLEDMTAIFHQLIGNNNTWAILTTKTLPKLPGMKMFLTQGEVRVNITCTPIEIVIESAIELEKLRRFHVMTFGDILRINKSHFIFDRQNGNNSYFVVPTRGTSIDWKTVGSFQGLNECIEPPESWRRKMIFKPEDYLYKIVQPWYKLGETKYIVMAVHTDKTPMSPFPEPDFKSYAEYYSKKYDKQIINPNQFLLETKGITSSLNLLHPGAASSGATSRGSRFMSTEFYIPELCHNFGFPADLWIKAAMLPSILHRIHFILLANKVHVSLNKHLGLCGSTEPLMIDVDKKINNDTKKMNREAIMVADDEDEDEFDDINRGLQVLSPITYPNPERTVAKMPTEALTSLTDNLQPWNLTEEPVDFDRNWDTIYDFELDYYVQFITRNFEDMKLSQYAEALSGTHEARFTTPKKKLRIEDAPMEEKKTIVLLDVIPKAPELRNVLKAITASSSMDVFDMERFEVLGDAFLKFAVSLYLIHRHDEWHEGYLTECKGKIVSNRNLFYIATRFQLPGIIKLFDFDPRNEWVPPLLQVPPNLKEFMNEANCSALELSNLKLSKEEIEAGHTKAATEVRFMSDLQRKKNTGSQDRGARCLLDQQYIADKTIADSMEALIGVYLHSVGIEKCLNLLSFFKILPGDDLLHSIFQRSMQSGLVKSHSEPELVDQLLLNYRTLESALGYTFNDRSYLLQALTHASFPTNSVTGCYQELEFIGDAILDFLISSYIFQRCPNMDPGQLTDLRSALVNNNTLACITVRNKIQPFILSQNAALQETISKFVDFQKKNEDRVTDQVQLLVTEYDILLADFIDVPKVLGDVFESLIGAIFFDSGNNLNVTWDVIYHLMHQEIDEFIANVPKQLIRRLTEWPNSQPKFGPPIPHEDFVKIALRFTCKNEVLEVFGFGQNKEDAKRAAAKAALLRLENPNQK